VHKLGAVYAALKCLPPKFNSQLQNLFLVLLFYADDRVKFGNEAIFSILIDDINNLRTKGVEICIEGKKYQLFFVMVQLLGDNLGLNSILGYVESFSANHYCRACKMHKQQMVSACFERSDLLRTVENYTEDVEKCDASQTGIKRSLYGIKHMVFMQLTIWLLM
jgi:hypothetical protein